ncbi:hypothetical protein RSSM_03425 [Rhodopirellula sallentina SM41]|uniref:Uncharacterized protein n=1 Tax=Rhodopirellula sallentina SM41 TaxID=1263870 RepID=M5UB73_9BACT|nr:hypothetical protein RSSM_03425 [Rhodopirellula sallentina SM41]
MLFVICRGLYVLPAEPKPFGELFDPGRRNLISSVLCQLSIDNLDQFVSTNSRDYV